MQNIKKDQQQILFSAKEEAKVKNQMKFTSMFNNWFLMAFI